jgi:hypothetical protein
MRVIQQHASYKRHFSLTNTTCGGCFTLPHNTEGALFGFGEVEELLTMNSATALVTSHNTEGALFGLGGVEALLTMNSATALMTSHNAEGAPDKVVKPAAAAFTPAPKAPRWMMSVKRKRDQPAVAVRSSHNYFSISILFLGAFEDALLISFTLAAGLF